MGEMQGVIIHGMEARTRPQGWGREEPNDDPFLDPNDPHLEKGRVTLLGVIGDGLAKAGGYIWSAAKYASMIRLAVYAAGGITALTSGVVFIVVSNQNNQKQ